MINSFLAMILSVSSAAAPDCDARLIEHLTREAPIIVVAKVEEVEPSLGFGSGYFTVAQRVNYEVEEVLKGKLAEGRINVGHYLVVNSPTADTCERARLSPKLFAKDNRLVLFLEPDTKKGYIGTHSDKPYKAYLALSENCVPRADAETVKTIRQILSTKTVH